MTSIQERYECARNSSNLKSKVDTTYSDSDVLAAAGMAAQANPDALLLWSVCYQGHSAAKIELVGALAHKLQGKLYQWHSSADARIVATEVVAWTLHGICNPCHGLGYKVIPDTPTLSDELCEHCHGTGKVELPDTPAHTWLHNYMQVLTANAAGHIMDKLSEEMDLLG